MDPGSRVKFTVYPTVGSRSRHGGNTRRGTVLSAQPLGEMIDVHLDGDPFGTYVSYERLELISGSRDDSDKLINPQHRRPTSAGRSNAAMPNTATKPSARVLRKQAKSLGIEGWEDMDLDELIEAVGDDAEEDEAPARPAKKKTAPASKTKKGSTPVSTKSPREKAKAAAKPASKREPVEVAENGNPYREGTQEWYITEELLKGGKRTSMVSRLKKKITITPRNESDDFDLDAAIDYRLQTTSQRLAKEYGYDYQREGRGADGSITVVPT